jgi:hypothetical protein
MSAVLTPPTPPPTVKLQIYNAQTKEWVYAGADQLTIGVLFRSNGAPTQVYQVTGAPTPDIGPLLGIPCIEVPSP